MAGWSGVSFLPWLRQPALIPAGDDDPIIPLANARLLHRLIRDSRMHVYPGGHLGLLTEAAGPRHHRPGRVRLRRGRMEAVR